MRRFDSRNGTLHLAPPAGRGRIALAIQVRGSLRKGTDNRFKYASHITQDVVIPKSEHEVVVVSEPFISNSVARTLRMLTAIDLHNQSAFATYEVDRVRSNRLLSDEFVSVQPARSQTIPEHPLRIRRRVSQAPRTFRPEFVSSAHAETPPHPSRFARRPLPARGERRRVA
jgi:hypothetical protein